MIYDQPIPVLVNEDTIYRRVDHNARLLLYGRPGQTQTFHSLWPQHQPISIYLSGDPWLEQVARGKSPESAIYPFRQIPQVQPAGQQVFYLTPPRPAPSLFEDKFVSVYAVIEQYSQTATTTFNPPQPYFLFFQDSGKPESFFFDDHSLDTGQTNHPYPHVIQIGIGLFPYSFEVADLNADPWLEWVPQHPAANIYPFRQIYITVPTVPRNLTWWQSKNLYVESEGIWRVPDNSTINQFRWQQVQPPTAIGPSPPDFSVWTTDSTAITADSVSFTCDGADLINGGSSGSVPQKGGGIAYTVSQILRF